MFEYKIPDALRSRIKLARDTEKYESIKQQDLSLDELNIHLAKLYHTLPGEGGEGDAKLFYLGYYHILDEHKKELTRYFVPNGLVRTFMNTTKFKGDIKDVVEKFFRDHPSEGVIAFQEGPPVYFRLKEYSEDEFEKYSSLVSSDTEFVSKWMLHLVSDTEHDESFMYNLLHDHHNFEELLKQMESASDILHISQDAADEGIVMTTNFIKFILYITCFPNALRDGTPNLAKLSKKQKKQYKTLLIDDQIKQFGRGSMTPHLRKGYYRTYTHARFKEARGQMRYVNPCFVNGKSKTADDTPLKK